MKKVVFMGTPQFSVPILENLVSAGYEVVYVVTQPDRAVGRKKVMTPPPVKAKALELGLEVLQPEKITQSEVLQTLLDTEFDLIVTAAFGQFLPENLLQHPKFGAINVHASLLPKYRGGAPVHYAILNGEEKTGVTIMRMVKKMDAGDMLAQVEVPILEEDNVGTMFEKVSFAGRDLLISILPEFFEGNIKEIPQDEESATFSPNILPEQEKIDWNESSRAIFNKVRAFYPWPVAHTYLNNERIKLQQVKVLEESSTEAPGTIIERSKKSLKVATGDEGVLAIEILQPIGKKPLTIQEYLNGVGRQVASGDQFGGN